MGSVTISSVIKYPDSWTTALKDAKAQLPANKYNQLQLLFAAAVGDIEQIDQSIKNGASLLATSASINHYSTQRHINIYPAGNPPQEPINPPLIDIHSDFTALDIACFHGSESALLRILEIAKIQKKTILLVQRKSSCGRFKYILENATTFFPRCQSSEISAKGFQQLIKAGANWQPDEIGYRGPFFMALSDERAYTKTHLEKALIILLLASQPYFSELNAKITETLPNMPHDLVKIFIEYCPPFCPEFLGAPFPKSKLGYIFGRQNNGRPNVMLSPLFMAINTGTQAAQEQARQRLQEINLTHSVGMVHLLLDAGADPHMMLHDPFKNEQTTALGYARSKKGEIPEKMLEAVNAAASPEIVRQNEALAASIKKATAETAYRKTYRYAAFNQIAQVCQFLGRLALSK